MQQTLIRFSFTVCLISLLLASCGPKLIPDEIEAHIDPTLSFEEIIENPETHLGKKILLGGEIIETHIYEKGSEIEILQKPLDSGRAPRYTDVSLGRFFLADSTFLDPAIFKSGRRITIVGVVKGMKSKQIGEGERRYPLLEKEFLHLWSPNRGPSDSAPHFSIGVGAIFSP